MAASARTIYWDACCFIDVIQATPHRIEILNALLESSRKGEIEIVTSILSIAEVAFVATERKGRELDETAEEKLDALWSDPSTIRLIETSRFTMREARTLTREARVHQIGRIDKSDIVHLATARRRKVDEFHTYETKMVRYAPICNFTIMEPYITQPSLPFPSSP